MIPKSSEQFRIEKIRQGDKWHACTYFIMAIDTSHWNQLPVSSGFRCDRGYGCVAHVYANLKKPPQEWLISRREGDVYTYVSAFPSRKREYRFLMMCPTTALLNVS